VVGYGGLHRTPLLLWWLQANWKSIVRTPHSGAMFNRSNAIHDILRAQGNCKQYQRASKLTFDSFTNDPNRLRARLLETAQHKFGLRYEKRPWDGDLCRVPDWKGADWKEPGRAPTGRALEAIGGDLGAIGAIGWPGDH